MISDTEARRLASAWHSGQGSALYALASTGAILAGTPRHDEPPEPTYPEVEIMSLDVKREIRQCAVATNSLRRLAEYVDHHGPRGPQPGWSDLSW